MSFMHIVKILLVRIYMAPVNFLRRMYWQYRYLKNPEETLKEVLGRFRTFLAVTPSYSKVRNREAQSSGGISLQTITIEGYIKVMSKIMRDERCVFLKKKNMDNVMERLKLKNMSYTHTCNCASGIEWLMRFWGINVKIPRPRKPERMQRDNLTEFDVSKLFKSCRSLRDKALLSVCAYAGPRTKEISKMKVGDFDAVGLSLFILNGKYSKDRKICISQEAADAIQGWIDLSKKSLMMLCSQKIREALGGPSNVS